MRNDYICACTDDRTGSEPGPTGGSSQPTSPRGGLNTPQVDNTSLIVGVVATVIAVVLVVIACLALGITLLVKFGRRDRPTQCSGKLGAQHR